MRGRLPLGVCAVAALVSCALYGADERRLAMLRDAQAAFDKVVANPAPVLGDASACVQTEAAALAVALAPEESELHYRKGFCALTLASITHAAGAFDDAARELSSGGAAMLAWLARRAGGGRGAGEWNQPDHCPESCQPLVATAQLWLGWQELEAGNLEAAGAKFAPHPETGWYAYARGRGEFQAGRYAEAVRQYQEARARWEERAALKNPPLAVRLAPPADPVQLLSELGGAQILAGDPAGAIATLDSALGSRPSAWAYFLRARAKELTGRAEPALADYNLASRAAFAESTGLASGEAHLFRGILFYRRRDYARAEDEFASALNFEIPSELRPDAAAWRHLSAVASGFCGASREYLERALPAVSPFFPKAEAQAVAAACPAGAW